jgi:hypothetical protein
VLRPSDLELRGVYFRGIYPADAPLHAGMSMCAVTSPRDAVRASLLFFRGRSLNPLTLIRGLPDFRGLHGQPRYKALLHKMNLPE